MMLVTHLSHMLLKRFPSLPLRGLTARHQLKHRSPGSRQISFWQPVNKPPDILDSTASLPDLYPKQQGNTSLVTKLWQSIKRAAGSEEADPDEQVTEYFQYSVERLMAYPGEFTFGKFSMYIEDICTKLRIIGKRAIPEDDLSGPLKQLKRQHEILKFLTPRERESDSASVFSHQAKLQLAESAKCTLKDVNEMLYHHDICKTDRTWYFRRLVLGRHLPTSYEEREHLSYQRPIAREAAQLFPETSSLEAAKIREMRDHVHYRKPPTKTWPWFRRPTSGKNKWSTREYTKRRLH